MVRPDLWPATSVVTAAAAGPSSSSVPTTFSSSPLASPAFFSSPLLLVVVLWAGTTQMAHRACRRASGRHDMKFGRRARAVPQAWPIVSARHDTRWCHAHRAHAASCSCRLVPVPCWAGRARWPSIYLAGLTPDDLKYYNKEHTHNSFTSKTNQSTNKTLLSHIYTPAKHCIWEVLHGSNIKEATMSTVHRSTRIWP
jgi:hypothetical protein